MLGSVLRRLALVLLGFALVACVLAAAEGVLWLVGGGETRLHDPFVGFAELVPMFELERDDAGRAVYRTALARRKRDRDEFLAEKPDDGFRVFVIGGSSAAGVSYGYPWAFAAWLERKLTDELPGRRVEVVNAALSGYASRRALAIVRELAGYQPDLLVVYAGHNEGAERRYYAHLLDLDPRLFAAWRAIAGTRVYAVLSDRFGIDRTIRPEDVRFDDGDALREMFATYERILSGRSATAVLAEREYADLYFEHNVRAMIDVMQGAGAEVLLVGVAQNLSDWSPGGSLHDPDLDDAALARFEARVQAGDAAEPSDCAHAELAWREALAIDAGVAEVHFRLARCARRRGDLALAREHFQLASDLDAIPHGAPSSRTAVLRAVAADHGVPFMDAAELLAGMAPDGLVGDDFFIDHVHPNLRSHVALAVAIGERLRQEGIPVAASQWAESRWSPPDVDALRAARPELRLEEHLLRAMSCALVRRVECVEAETTAALEIDPTEDRVQSAFDVMKMVRAFAEEHS